MTTRIPSRHASAPAPATRAVTTTATTASDGHGHGHGGDCDERDSCAVDDLVEGAVVHEAEIRVSGDGAVFKGIKLIKSSTTS